MARLESLSARFVLLLGWNRYLAALAAGLLSALSMAPLDFSPILFLTIPVFVWILDGVYADGKNGWYAALKSPFLCGWWFGFGYFLMGLWWVGNAFLVEAEEFIWLLPFAVILLPAGLAVFWGIAALLSRLLWSDRWPRVFALVFSFALLEYLRSFVFTGLAWNALGYAAMPLPVFMQSASVVGLHGITAISLLVFAIPLTVLAMPIGLIVGRKMPLLLTVFLISLHLGYGAYKMTGNPTEYEPEVTLRLMQPNIDQKMKFDREQEAGIIQKYLKLSEATSSDGKSLAGTDYLIWPESAFPFLLTERRDVLASIGSLLPNGTRLVTGAMRAEPGAAGNPYGNVYNSIFLIADNGEIVEAADKTHLVPFGEYLPFQATLEDLGFEQLTRLRGGFEAGAARKLLAQGSNHPILPLICYEIIFPSEVRQDFYRSSFAPKWIVNLTNDAWFGFTPGPYQHLRQSIVRGVELGLPVIRVANSGISVVTDASGRILKRLELGQDGIIDSALPKAAATTIYSSFGELPFFGFLFFCLLVAITSLLRRKNQIS